MPVTTSADGLSVVHTKSDGKANATIPDVCLVPAPPGGPVPIPFPNNVKAEDIKKGSVLTKIDGGSVALQGSYCEKSTGDAGGVIGGVASGCTQGKAHFLKWSSTFKIEGRPVCRKSDMMLMNNSNTLSLSGMNLDDIDQSDSEELKGWIKIKLVDVATREPLKGVMVKVTLPDGSEEEIMSGICGNIKYFGIEEGNCNLVLNEEDEDTIYMGISPDLPGTELATRNKHVVGIKVDKTNLLSG